MRIAFIIALAAGAALAQTETLTNSQIIEMTAVGLDRDVIILKINESGHRFDVSVEALVALKKAGVDKDVIALMYRKASEKPVQKKPEPAFSDSVPVGAETDPAVTVPTAKRTIAIEKSSIHPSRQALEKELLKRREWERFNLLIVRYKESADYYIEIGRVPFSLVTHRYTFRVYDRRTGAVIAAGETTSWGSLAENLAREIAKKLDAALKV
jgi:hypothetical protein